MIMKIKKQRKVTLFSAELYKGFSVDSSNWIFSIQRMVLPVSRAEERRGGRAS